MAMHDDFREHDGTWLHTHGRKAGKPVGPLRRRRLRRSLVTVAPRSEGDDLGGGTAGVREPRHPLPPTPSAAAVELPVD